ncbi:MAG: class I SAM-dependent methyltransferase [Pseudomonadota bacterium]
MRTEILKGYEEAADGDFIQRVEAISSADLLAPAIKHISKQPCRVLDVGAGTGRDAAWFASLSHRVVAVEPVDALRRAGMAMHNSPKISWIKDALPELPNTISLGQAFDIVLLCAVWQHLDDADRRTALSTLRSVTVDGGKVIVSIRHGAGAPTRPVFPAHVENTVRWAKPAGFDVTEETTTQSVQSGNRQAGVTWTWLVLQAQGVGQ